MSDLPASASASSDVGTASGGASAAKARKRRRWLAWTGRVALGIAGLVLVVVVFVVARRDALLAGQVLTRIGPLIGGTLTADSVHLDLAPLALQATGIHLEIPQIKGPIQARSLTATLLAGNVVLEGVEVRRAEGADRAPVLTVKSIEGRVDLRKVISAPYPVEEVTIEEPVFRARLLEPGWTNIQALLGLQKPNPAKLPPTTPPVVPVPAAAAAAPTPAPHAVFFLRHARIEHGRLIYDDPLSDAVNPVHLEIEDLTADVRDFQYLGAPYGDPLTDVRVDGRIVQKQQPGWLHVRAWGEPWRAKPTVTILAAITGFDVRSIDPYTAGTGGAALGGDWIHVLLDVKAIDAKIRTGVVAVTIAESGTEMRAPFTGDLFRPTIDKNSALVSAFQLPLGHLLKLGNVSLDVAGQLAIAGLESVLRLGQGAADAGSAVGSSSSEAGSGGAKPAGGDDFLSSLGRGISAFGAGVANAAKRLFQGGEQGVNTVSGYGTNGRPMTEILAEFGPRHRETERAFLRERIRAAQTLDPARVESLEGELAELGPSTVASAPGQPAAATSAAPSAAAQPHPTDEVE